MATVERPVSERPAARPGPTTPYVGPPRRSLLSYALTALLILTLVIAHIVGWQISKIDPAVLVTKSPEIGRFLSELIRPDFIGQDQKQIAVSIPVVGTADPVQNPSATDQEPQQVQPVVRANSLDAHPQNVDTNPQTFNVELQSSAAVAAPGQKMTVTAKGLRPNTTADVTWQNTGTNSFAQQIGSGVTDADGNLSVEVQVPSDLDRVVNVYSFPNTLTVSQTWGFGDIYPSEKLKQALGLIVETIFLALMGTTSAVVISIPLSFLASRNLMSHNPVALAVYTATRTVLNLLRSIEVLILAVIFAATVGLGPFAGVLALTIHSVASLGKLYSEAIEAIDPGPIEAITATGANRVQVVVYAVVPQVIPQFLSFTLYRWDINVRMSTIIGFVGGGGIGYILQQDINLLHWNQAATSLWAIAAVVIAMDYLSARLRALFI